MFKHIRSAIAAALLLAVPTLAAASPFGVNLPAPSVSAGYFIDGMLVAPPWTTLANGQLTSGTALISTVQDEPHDIITENVAQFSTPGGVVNAKTNVAGPIIVKAPAHSVTLLFRDRSNIQISVLPIDATKPVVVHVVPTKWRARWDAGERISPDLIARLRGFGTIRSMDAMRTNGSTVTDKRPLETDTSYSGGIPVEVMADIANLAGTDLIINIPHLATEAVATDMITSAARRLNPDLHLLVEYSNEVWNGGFPQSKWGASQAVIAKVALSTFYGQMNGRLALDIQKAGIAPGHAKLMLSWQFVSPSQWTTIFSGYKSTGAPFTLIDSISGAVYPQGLKNPDYTAWANAGNFTAANAFLDNWEVTRSPNFAKHAAAAKSIGVSFDLYEASVGQLTSAAPVIADAAVRPTVTDFNIALTHSPEGVARFKRLMEAFASVGGRTANYFNLVGVDSQYGVYGVYSSMQDTVGTPIRAYLDQANAAEWAARQRGWLQPTR